MMVKAVILAGGSGTRLWPYAQIRNKVMAPVANRPLAAWAAETALAAGADEVIVAAGPHRAQIANAFAGQAGVRVVDVGRTQGPAFTLAAVKPCVEDDLLVLNGDTLYEVADLRLLVERLQRGSPSVLLAKLEEGEHHETICAEAVGGMLASIEGHPLRRMDRRIAAYGVTAALWPFIETCSTLMADIPVGMMPPLEGFLEMALADALRAGVGIEAVDAASACIDVDKPWQLLAANWSKAEALCSAVQATVLGEGSSIAPSAHIEGHVVLGRNCTIGRNVLIKGNMIVGDDTEIVDGAMILGNAIIGSNCSIRHGCLIEGGSVIGNRCVVGHGAELFGVIFDTVYLYHYMEFSGIIGRNTDLGAATVCGTLRFDNGETVHTVKGRRERPRSFANATYLGDFCRTGVNAILMPGVKTGVYSIVGPGVVLMEDLPDNKIIMVKQETTVRDWSPDRYGW
jgi:UDP-N-acetylglucosamine diphosphorylase / glucose-1-phosphate thymidylyltransferase / UDP-N-acetylgalactosamine diphosphorylase / glucosamine-1-phosphate N-acetyltransferase / galactosamine-1-phosphate N-acetyltransferase